MIARLYSSDLRFGQVGSEFYYTAEGVATGFEQSEP